MIWRKGININIKRYPQQDEYRETVYTQGTDRNHSSKLAFPPTTVSQWTIPSVCEAIWIWIGFGKHKWTRKITKQKHEVLAVDMLDARIMKGLLLKQLQAWPTSHTKPFSSEVLQFRKQENTLIIAYKSQEKSQSTNSKYFLTFFEMFMANVMII